MLSSEISFVAHEPGAITARGMRGGLATVARYGLRVAFLFTQADGYLTTLLGSQFGASAAACVILQPLDQAIYISHSFSCGSAMIVCEPSGLMVMLRPWPMSIFQSGPSGVM